MSDTTTPLVTADLRAVGLFAELPAEILESLVRSAQTVLYEDGDTIFLEGDAGDGAYLILSGSVRIYTEAKDGSEIVLARLEAHEMLGEHSLLDRLPAKRSASACAINQTTLLFLPAANFFQLLDLQPELAERLSQRRETRERENIARRSSLYDTLRTITPTDTSGSRKFPADTVIFREGEVADEIFFIVSGNACVYRDNAPENILAELGPGECFGERACISDSPRTATVRSRTALDTIVIGKDSFLRAYDQSPLLKGYTKALEFTYHLPNRGTALQYAARHRGHESLDRSYRLDDGRVIHSSYVVSLRTFSLEQVSPALISPPQEWVWRHPQGDGERALFTDAKGRIVRIVGFGTWPDLPGLVEAALDGITLTPAQLAPFAKTGGIAALAPRDSLVTDPNEILCFCMQVRRGTLVEAVASGCQNFEQLSRKTGCGTMCMGCEPRIQAFLGHSNLIPVTATAIPINPLVSRFRLTPTTGESYPAPTPGQHLVVEGEIDSQWVARTYTITSAAIEADAVEITVKKEPRGYFSNWLFSGDLTKKNLRISPPRGHAVWQDDGLPTVCFVAGIGVTPAVAIFRTMQARGGGRQLHIDYACRDVLDAPFLHEFQAGAAADPAISLCVRAPGQAARLSEAAVRETALRFPGARYFVCGPLPYMAQVRKGLLRAGVAPAQILEEHFLHAGGPRPAGRSLAWPLAYVGGLAAALLLTLFLLLPQGEAFTPSGAANSGHENLSCHDCHTPAPGTTRQQLQAKFAYWMGRRESNVDFINTAVNNAVCTDCHARPNDSHPTHLFLEARYQPVRESLGPHLCVNCHREHQ
ncbi:MAG: cyclic nucleotide-binding domain-containing protein, partial [Betaproteobacteria bacterium]|nr:cyclic nucleotide-binding domain-containing protein [Betaproteobacteria bacterium]